MAPKLRAVRPQEGRKFEAACLLGMPSVLQAASGLRAICPARGIAARSGPWSLYAHPPHHRPHVVSAGRGRRGVGVVAPSPRPKKAGLTYGKEEVFVVEAQPGSVSAVASLESLDVVDKLPASVVTPFAMDVMER